MLKGYIPSLDGFRAISILLVIFGHLIINQLLPAPLYSILKEVSFGELGVRIFFVISGFLITYLLLKERSKNGGVNLKAFYIRRLLRIFPVFYFYLGIVAILNFSLGFQVPSLYFLSAALYIQNFSPWGSSWLIGHSWSLAVEEQFYLLWPAIFFVSKNLKSFLYGY